MHKEKIEDANHDSPEILQYFQKVVLRLNVLLSERIFYTLHEKKIKNVKSGFLKSKDEIFSPEINSNSKILAQNRLNRLRQSIDTRSARRSSDINKQIEQVEMLYLQQDLAHQKINDKKYLKDRNEFSECTFKPKINKKSIHLVSSEKEQVSSLKKAYERMQKDKMSKKSMINSLIKVDVDKECTFQPSINKSNFESIKESKFYPKDYEKSVGRVRYGYDERVRKQMLLDYVPRGEYLEFHRALPSNPPKCAENYVVRVPEPFIFLNVNVRGGKKGTIALRVDDIPEAKAEEFATEFQLEGEEQEQLQQMIFDYIQEEIRKTR